MKLTLKEKLVIHTIFTDSSHYLLMEETNIGEKNFPNAVFVTMFFPTTISDFTVKKAFLEFGEVHDVFYSKLKKPYNNISNGKRPIRITPYKTKHGIPHEIFSGDS